MRVARLLLGGVGVLLVLVGAWHLLLDERPDLPDLVNIVVFLAGGVIAHDVVLGPLVVVVGALAVPRLPEWSRAPVVAGLVVLGSLTLLAVPVLGRFGARSDDPWLLNRSYSGCGCCSWCWSPSWSPRPRSCGVAGDAVTRPACHVPDRTGVRDTVGATNRSPARGSCPQGATSGS